jgi:hypothetical protein
MARSSSRYPDSMMYYAFARDVCRNLGIAHLRIRYRFRTMESCAGYVLHHVSLAGKAIDALIVIDRCAFDGDIKLTIAHELRHVWQDHVGWMRRDAGGIYWHGQLVCTQSEEDVIYRKDKTAYHNLPWELDAELYALRICNELKGIV